MIVAVANQSMRMGKPRRSVKPENSLMIYKVDGSSENNASYKCCIGQSDTVVSGAIDHSTHAGLPRIAFVRKTTVGESSAQVKQYPKHMRMID